MDEDEQDGGFDTSNLEGGMDFGGGASSLDARVWGAWKPFSCILFASFAHTQAGGWMVWVAWVAWAGWAAWVSFAERPLRFCARVASYAPSFLFISNMLPHFFHFSGGMGGMGGMGGPGACVLACVGSSLKRRRPTILATHLRAAFFPALLCPCAVLPLPRPQAASTWRL